MAGKARAAREPSAIMYSKSRQAGCIGQQQLPSAGGALFAAGRLYVQEEAARSCT